MRLASLGPAGTFSEVACEEFIRQSELVGEPTIILMNNLQRVLQAVPDAADIALVPIENVSEGFVPIVLDCLVSADLHIVSEVRLSIAFSACGYVTDKSQITRLYVQFIAQGQCREFIDSLVNVEVVATQSNTESLALATRHGQGAAAIVPAHIMTSPAAAEITWQQPDVHDYAHNETRFLALAQGPVPAHAQGHTTSLLVINKNDRPGLLEKVLHCFSTRKLNLSSIVSRPTGQGFGQYHFFMDVQVSLSNIAMQGALKSLAEIAEVKVLGCY